MELTTLKTNQLTESKTNPRGKEAFKDESFQDLVSSIKEKGVLVPILVREINADKGGLRTYEIIAGHRRFRAAKEAGIEEIPATVAVMDDTEAREAQIIENLQRADVHPMDEADAFKFLADESNQTVQDIARKVGKSERYVRDRLGLTNLVPEARKGFKAGEISLTSAILISKVEDLKVQKDIAKEAIENGYDGRYLKRQIQEQVFNAYRNKPWAKDAKLAEIFGGEKRATLFGTDADDLEDPAEHAKKMAAFLEYTIRTNEEKGNKIVKIYSGYGAPEQSGVLSRDQYKVLDTAKERKEANEDILGLIVEGYDVGKVVHISTDPEDLKDSVSSTSHKMTPEEKEKKKKEKAKKAEKTQKMIEEWKESLEKVAFPLTKEKVGLLFEFALHRCGTSYQMPVVKTLGLEVITTKEKNGWDDKYRNVRDYQKTLEQYADTDSKKLQVVFALLMPQVPTNDYDDGKEFAKAVKKL